MKIKVTKANKSNKDILKNLYVYYRYDLFLHSGDDTSLALNKYGIVYGRKYRTHDSAMAEFDEIVNYPKSIVVYLFYTNKTPIGFAIVLKQNGIHHKIDYKLDEFFIVNKYRKQGFGEQAFCEIIKRYKGIWVLEILKENKPALLFWKKIINRNIGFYKKVTIPENIEREIPETIGLEFCSK